jgi:hypothetical protein
MVAATEHRIEQLLFSLWTDPPPQYHVGLSVGEGVVEDASTWRRSLLHLRLKVGNDSCGGRA